MALTDWFWVVYLTVVDNTACRLLGHRVVRDPVLVDVCARCGAAT